MHNIKIISNIFYILLNYILQLLKYIGITQKWVVVCQRKQNLKLHYIFQKLVVKCYKNLKKKTKMDK